MTFKAGDCVRRINSDNCEIKQNGIYTVNWVSASGVILTLLESDDTEYTYASKNFELVKNGMPTLKSGMRVQHRNGKIFMVIKDLDRLYQPSGYNNLSDFNLETGKHEKSFGDGPAQSEWDIVRVFQGETNSHLMNLNQLGAMIWEYVNPVEQAKQKRRNELNDIIIQAKCELDSLSED